MNYCQRYARSKLAAGVTLLLAAILVIACGAEAGPVSATVTKLPAVMTATSPSKTPIPATRTLSQTPLPPTPTPSSTSSPTLNITPSPSPTPTGPMASSEPTYEPASIPPAETPNSTGLKISETTITLPTYPIWDYLIERTDSVYNIPVFYFNRLEFEAAAPRPTPVTYIGIVLENAYLRLTFLPELGGRLYSSVVKATGQEIFYHNPVVKPSRYGVLVPYEANWWLATGGMEWTYPTQEHGYRWGVPWEYETNLYGDRATITLRDIAPGRVGVEVTVTLPIDSAAFSVAPKLFNAGSEIVPIQFWLNAALSLAPGSMSPQTQFVVPVDKVVVHSRGEEGWSIPETQAEIPWPLVGQTDLRDYRQWANYLGFFVPNMEAPFIGAFNPETNLGVVRLIEPGTVPGTKLFAFGSDFPDRSYTDDDTQYFEIWGGANPGFWPEDDILVASGETLAWQEDWWPLAGLGGLTWANQHAAIYLSQSEDIYRLSALVSRPEHGTLKVQAGDTTIFTASFTGDPMVPLQWEFAATDATVRVQLTDDSGNVLLDYLEDD